MPLESGNLTRDEAQRRAGAISDLAYEVDLDLRDEESFRSRTTLTFAAVPGTETFLDLTALRIDEVEVNGDVIAVDDYDGTRIALPPLASENQVIVEAVCAYEHSGAGLHRFEDPEDGTIHLHTQFEPFDAHRVFACFDQPDLKATFRLHAHAPTSWQVVSNTPGVSDQDTWRFEQTALLPTYLVALVAGPLEVVRDEHNGIPLGLWSRPSMAKHVEQEELFALTKAGLDYFAEAFGTPYPFGKYDQLFVPEFSFGAMENPGCVTFHEHYLFRGRVTDSERESRANTLLHEMAHMWFGDLVTMRWWDDLWLNESFATFMATLALERATRFTGSWVTFADEEKAWARRQDQLPTTHPIASDAPDVHTALQNFDGITYAKGAAVLRQLVAWVGEEAFLSGCKRYFASYAFANAELADFLLELEAASGRKLDDWAERWLRTTGLNTVAIAASEIDGAYADVTLTQTAPDDHPTLRPHRLGVGIYDLEEEVGLRQRRRIELDVDGATTTLPTLDGEPLADLVLGNDGDLSFVKVALDERSLATVEQHLATLDDPLARTLCWAAAWEMLRDAEIPAGRLLELVRLNASSEEDVGVLATLLSRARSAALLYGDPGRADARLDVLAAAARSEMERADPASDHQLAWARQWIACARNDDEARDVRGLLDGSFAVDGLDVDTELRWQIVGALAAGGHLDDEVIAEEQRRDPSDIGARRAEAARAARPLAEAKEQAWKRVVDEPELSHSLTKAIAGGFAQRGQESLLAPFVPRYFADLSRIWEERQLEIAISISRSLYPTYAVTDAVIEATDAHLEDDGLKPPLRRTLLEERDTVLRALRTRDLDRES